MTFTISILGCRAAPGRGFGPHHSDLGARMPVFPAAVCAEVNVPKQPAVLAAGRRMPTAGRFCWRAARIAAALRAWFAAQDFVEVETAALQVSPGNETHLHAFATELIGPGGERRAALSAHLAGIRLQEAAGGGRARASSNSPACSATASAARCIIPNSRMLEWYRAERALRGADGRLRGAAAAKRREAAGTTRISFPRHRRAIPFAAPERVTVAEAFERYAGIDLLATVDGRRGRPRRARRGGASGRGRDRGRRQLGRHLQPRAGRADRAASRHRPRHDPLRVSAAAGGAGARQAGQRRASPSASSFMPAASSSPTPSAS